MKIEGNCRKCGKYGHRAVECRSVNVMEPKNLPVPDDELWMFSIEPDKEETENVIEPEPEEEVCYVCGGAAGLDHEAQFCPLLSEERDLMD
eukprot:3694054-Heterocapsa_arctica.AAC.1